MLLFWISAKKIRNKAKIVNEFVQIATHITKEHFEGKKFTL